MFYIVTMAFELLTFMCLLICCTHDCQDKKLALTSPLQIKIIAFCIKLMAVQYELIFLIVLLIVW